MRRYVEILFVLAVVAIVTTAFRKPQEASPESDSQVVDSEIIETIQLPPRRRIFTSGPIPTEGTLALNGISLNDSLDELEDRMGPPQFAWPKRGVVQWEKQEGVFSRVAYRRDDEGVRRVTGVEATGVLTRGGTALIAFADPKAILLKRVGQPRRIEGEQIYYYAGFELSCGDLVGVITLGESFGMGAARKGPF